MDRKNTCRQCDVKKDGGNTVSSTRNADARRKQSPVPIKRTITQTGRYMSETCKDLQPGEARAPDGSKIMVQ